ncbi:putative transcriptional regulator, PadR-like family [Methylorubrum populi]|uniref:Putative transcriptional regulator, PadR-like family n=1 Tax=Methylorubrum populi TaxID=223967 RepID=A0A160PF74_9HYPH|nr:helix-turn-helix transcriptional regulator [Methylorubrum populi]BAU91175.1 putative transcriptional regulator, PadR-like family [Methylorubrum populi]
MARSSKSINGTDQQIMLAILRLHPNGYGISIRDELESRTKQKWSLGSIYAAVDRLEERGFLKSREGEPTAERGGRRKIYFELTGIGRATLDSSLSALDALRGYTGLGALARRFVLGGCHD